MNLETGYTLEIDGIKIQGLSLSGIRTSITLPQYQICFDVAQGFPFSQRAKNYFITHGHLDHAAGIPYLISQKAMHNEKPAAYYMPKGLVEPLTQIMKIWESIEDHQYSLIFEPAFVGQEIQLHQDCFIKPFKTHHRIESLGYTLFSKKKRLKGEFQDKPGHKIAEIRAQGHPIEEEWAEPLFSFTGDTQIDFLETCEWINKTKILMLEATYLDSSKSIEHARKWGHTHLFEIIPRLDQIESEKIVLIHSSSRYSLLEAERLVTEALPYEHRDRVLLFQGR